MSQIPREFLSRCFVPQESLALLLRRENPPTVLQRVVSRERVLETRYQAWLSHQNTAGADIYFAANDSASNGLAVAPTWRLDRWM